MLTHDFQPNTHRILQGRWRQATRLFHIKHRRQIARNELSRSDEVLGLTTRGEVGQELVVGTAQHTVFGSPFVILLVAAVHH